jgi:hypothetical protein
MGRRKGLLALLLSGPKGPMRPQNRCRACGHSWYPRGSNFSPRCPRCGADRTIAPPAAPARTLTPTAAPASGGGTAFLVAGGLGLAALGITTICCLVAFSADREAPRPSSPAAAVPEVAAVDAGTHMPHAGLCGSPHALAESVHRPHWRRWRCRSEAQSSRWNECLPREAYASHHGDGCPGVQRCCPPPEVEPAAEAPNEALSDEDLRVLENIGESSGASEAENTPR